MTSFTVLESAVLRKICERSPARGALEQLLSTASVTDRENTGHGFNTRFELDPRLPSVPSLEDPILGGAALLNDIGVLMGFLLWSKDGRPHCLEGFQYGDRDGATVDLKNLNLEALRYSALIPNPEGVELG